MRILISSFAALAALTLCWPILGLPAYATILLTAASFCAAWTASHPVSFKGRVKDSTQPDLTQGYTKEYVSARANQIRRQLIVLRSDVDAIASRGADPDSELTQLLSQLRVDVEKVLQNLEAQPSDMSLMGLQLESIDPLAKIIGNCKKFTETGVSGEKLDKALELAKNALRTTSEGFSEKHERTLQQDDIIQLKGWAGTVEKLNYN